ISEYQSIEGDSVSLPCNISAGEWNEAHISLVVWYRSGNQGNPIYSIDARNSLAAPRHQVTPELSGRLRMDFTTRPPVLHIDSVKGEDRGDYRCRVDYRVNRTQHFLIHLNVSVPPKEVIIRDLVGNVVQGMTGVPYNEGDKVALFCDATGGFPPPIVIWRSNDGRIIDETYESLGPGTNVTRNGLSLPRIERNHLLQELSCEAFPPTSSTVLPSTSPSSSSSISSSSSPYTSMVSSSHQSSLSFIRRSSVVLDLNLKPLVVQIQVPNFVSSSSSSSLLSSNRSGSGTLPLSSSSSSLSASTQSSNSRLLVVSAGRKTNIECRSWGSRPPAEITWWRGSRRLPTAASRSHYTDSQESESSPISGNDATNLTISILSYTAASEDDGQRLTCRADNLQLSNEELEDSVIIFVRYAPQLSLSLGAKIPETMREGSDVYFECMARANPPLSEVVWLFEGRPLINDPVSGILLTNQSLVMQRVRREHRGNYQCVASNAEGITASNKVFLNVLFAPVCRPGQTIIFGVARTEQVVIPCEVEAEPVTPINFRWFFNNSLESFELSKSDFNVELLKMPTPGLSSEHGKTLYSGSPLLTQLSLESALTSMNSGSFNQNGPSVARSNATYSPRSRLGYGTLYCLAENSIGVQRDPCTFNIVEAGPPHPVHDCLIVNVTMTSFVLKCIAGENGGLRQNFHLEVYNIEKEHLQVNVTSLESPIFTVENLPHNTAFTLNAFSSNAKGRSDSVTLRTATTAHAEKHTTNGKKQNVLFSDVNDLIFSPMFGALLGALISLLLLLGAIIAFVRHRVCTTKRHVVNKDTSNSNNGSTNCSSELCIAEPLKDDYGVAHSSTMQSIDEYILRTSQYNSTGGQINQTYYRFQPHSGTLPLLQHPHGIISNHTSNPSTMTEMSIVNNHHSHHQAQQQQQQHLDSNSYYSSSNPNYPPDPSAILHHSQQPSSDLMTNAFTYNVNTSTGIYPISSDLVPSLSNNGISNQTSQQRTYTEISNADMSHHVTALGPMVGCIDSVSSSTSDKTVEVDDEWHVPKQHSHPLIIGHNGSHQSQPPYMSYVRSNDSCVSSPNANNTSSRSTQPKVQFTEPPVNGSPLKSTSVV
ncbi:hypothetical protein RDWZM_001295, partial [Blomia tropicalis]